MPSKEFQLMEQAFGFGGFGACTRMVEQRKREIRAKRGVARLQKIPDQTFPMESIVFIGKAKCEPKGV